MSEILINIPNDERENGRTQDSAKYNKDCDDFQCLEDGTITKECKYCNLSTQCRQVDILVNGVTMPMTAHYLPILDPDNGRIMEWEYFCTGMHDHRPRSERAEDDKVS
jgi:hypothetical protein